MFLRTTTSSSSDMRPSPKRLAAFAETRQGKLNSQPQHHNRHLPHQHLHLRSLATMYASRALTGALRTGAPRISVAARVAATRSYAAAAAPSSANTKPPVALFGIDGTYASALVRISVALGNWLNCPMGTRWGKTQWLRNRSLTFFLVHRSRQDQRPRPHRQIARLALHRLQEGPEARDDPQCAHALRVRQAAGHCRAAEAHWRPGQGRHREELPRDAGCEQQAWCS
jgi:hypothetical protein